MTHISEFLFSSKHGVRTRTNSSDGVANAVRLEDIGKHWRITALAVILVFAMFVGVHNASASVQYQQSNIGNSVPLTWANNNWHMFVQPANFTGIYSENPSTFFTVIEPITNIVLKLSSGSCNSVNVILNGIYIDNFVEVNNLCSASVFYNTGFQFRSFDLQADYMTNLELSASNLNSGSSFGMAWLYPLLPYNPAFALCSNNDCSGAFVPPVLPNGIVSQILPSLPPAETLFLQNPVEFSGTYNNNTFVLPDFSLSLYNKIQIQASSTNPQNSFLHNYNLDIATTSGSNLLYYYTKNLLYNGEYTGRIRLYDDNHGIGTPWVALGTFSLSTTTSSIINEFSTSTISFFSIGLLATKFPFSYVYEINTLWSSLFEQNPKPLSIVIPFGSVGFITLINSKMLSDLPFASLLKSFITMALWLGFALFVYRRLLTIHNREHMIK